MTGIRVSASFLCGILRLSFITAYENLALHKPAWQENPYIPREHVGAEYAVDGRRANRSQVEEHCTLSDGNQTAEWRVDLGGVYSIHHIFIQYRAGDSPWGERNYFTVYFLGFSVFISNTTNKEDGVLCFKDLKYTRATIPNPVNVTCRHYGRYVIYYNNRTHPPFPAGYSELAFSDLCEVEVYGCSTPGRYGENCSLECPLNCEGGNCEIVKGTCFGCVVGHKGNRCDAGCIDGYFGENCSECPMNCFNGMCDRNTGDCFECEVGYTGQKCGNGCSFGWYGKNCSQPCGDCLNLETCDHITGHCPLGCSPGWMGYKCNTLCEHGPFGVGCNYTCNNMNCLNNTDCDPVFGDCASGCVTGWAGKFCNDCAPFKYGEYCNNTCSVNCQGQRCNQTTGHCLACNESRYGLFCENENPTSRKVSETVFDAHIGFITTSSLLAIITAGIVVYILKRNCSSSCTRVRGQHYEMAVAPSTSTGYDEILMNDLEIQTGNKTSECLEEPSQVESTFSEVYINITSEND